MELQIGSNIRKLRIQRSMTQREVANSLSVTVQAVLRDMGVTDEQMEQAWGKDMLEVNKKAGTGDKARQAERIWTGEPEIWNRHAPILFPFVGKVKDGTYRIGDKEFAMKTQHGFARDSEFALVEQNDSKKNSRRSA